MTCKPIQNPSGVTLVRIALLRLRDLELTDLEPIAVIPPTLKAFKKSNTVRLLLLLRSQFHDKGIFLKAYTEMAYGQFPPATRCTLTVLIHLFHTTLKPQLDEAVIEWLLAK
jgi:hypothetical protein